MKKHLLLLISLTMAIATTHAAYRIDVNIEGANEIWIYLMGYNGVKLEKVDSIKSNKKGIARFANSKKDLPGGLYSLHFTVDNSKQQIDFLSSGEKKFELLISANTLNIQRSLKYEKSRDNDGFKKYIDEQMSWGKNAQILEERFKKNQNDPDSMIHIQYLYSEMIKEQKAGIAKIIEEYKGTLASSIIKSVQEVEPNMEEMKVSDTIANADSIRHALFLTFAKGHFFNNIDFSDHRLINTPFFENRFQLFFQQIMLREPAEDINLCIDSLLKKAKVNTTTYAYTLRWLYGRYTESPVEGHQDVALHLCNYMADSTSITLTAREKAILKRDIKKYTLNPVGNIATDLTLQTVDGEFKSLHTVKAPFTVLYFFNPGCGTCRMITPVLYEMYQKYKNTGLKVFAVFPDKDSAAWQTYIQENNYTDWENVWDKEGNADIYEKYSLHAIPNIYYLDEEKRIMYKDIHLEDLEGILYVTLGSKLNQNLEKKEEVVEQQSKIITQEFPIELQPAPTKKNASKTKKKK
ncbi:MAG: thioredoxin-like domain-containing protein [Bacteroidales bacterium]